MVAVALRPSSPHGEADSGVPASCSEGEEEEEEEEEEPPVTVVRAELVRSHRPVAVSDVPVYVTIRDREGRSFEDRGACPYVRYRWMRGPVIKPCVFHPHKASQYRDSTRTFQFYCSRECFLRGWHNLPRDLWGPCPEGAAGGAGAGAEPEAGAEWAEVATTRYYCAGPEDINRPLRLEVIALRRDGRDAAASYGRSVTTGTVIPTPKEARTRRMISRGGSFSAEWLGKQFKVMNWNVLADLYATEQYFPYCERWALSWSWRRHLIIKELKSMTADIITLQEVQKDAFEEWFRPQLAEAGYDGVFHQKKREPIFHRGRYTAEGCATFYKTSRFQRVTKRVVDYDQLSVGELRCMPSPQDAERCLQRASKGNIALELILEDRQIRAAGRPSGPGGGRLLAVVNTHILADPGFADIKLFQAHLLLRALEQARPRLPLLLCGDFNSTPSSAVYEYLLRGAVRRDHEELRRDPCRLLEHLRLGHSLRLSTAYASCIGREAEYTNYTEEFKGALDYIFFSADSLSPLAVSQVDEEAQLLRETALPSSTRPSDHISLVATFMFREDAPPHPEAGSRQPAAAPAAPLGASKGLSPHHGHVAHRTGSVDPSADVGGIEGLFLPSPHAYASTTGYPGAWCGI